MNQIDYLGPNSYPAILNAIRDKMSTAYKGLKTIEAQQLFESTLEIMSNSVAPMHEIKQFRTNAQELQNRDASVADVLNFINKKEENGDYNFLINLATEEHLQNLHRAGLPNVQQTIESIRAELAEPSSTIETSIKNGIFDDLQSNMMLTLKSQVGGVDIKSGLPLSKNKVNAQTKPTTSAVFESTLISNDIISYVPVGVKVEDPKNNRTILLTESCALEYNRGHDKFEVIDDVSTLSLTENYSFLMESITSLPYNPNNKHFNLLESWDFNLALDLKNNIVMLGGDIISNDDVPGLLMESINYYDESGIITSPEQRKRFVQDADKFINLMENASNILNIDKLMVLKNTNTQVYTLFESTMYEPRILHTNSPDNVKVNTYQELFESTVNILNVPAGNVNNIRPLFESNIQDEQELFKSQIDLQNELLQEQGILNSTITDLQQLQEIAEPESPAYQKITDKLNQANELLEQNIASLQKF